MLKEVIVAVKEFFALRKSAFEGLFMGMNGSNVSLQVLPSVEALPATINFADIDTLFRLNCTGSTGSTGIESLSGWDTASSTLFCEVGHWDWEHSTTPRDATVTLSVGGSSNFEERNPGSRWRQHLRPRGSRRNVGRRSDGLGCRSRGRSIFCLLSG